ncbi:MAG: fluoride efflux transporter FluC [Acidimicrobiales bacterium]
MALGGFFGAAAREAVEQALPAHGGFPLATLLVNVSGAAALGIVLELLVRRGEDRGRRRRVRLLAGTGFLGAFTTYSTFATEIDLLVRGHNDTTAVLYALVTLLGGMAAAFIGMVVAAAIHSRLEELPVDPDVDDEYR